MKDIQRIGVGNSNHPSIDEAVFGAENEVFTFDSTVVFFDSTNDTFDEQL